jgi:hypothetical protein
MPKGKSLSVDIRKLIIDKFQSGERQSDIAKAVNDQLFQTQFLCTIKLWDHLDRAIRKENGGKFESREDLLEAAQRTWNNITSEYIDKLIFSMPRKCAEIIKHNGYSTCY